MKIFNKRMAMFGIVIFIMFVSGACTIKKSDEQLNNTVYRIGDEGDYGYPSPYSVVPRGPGFARLQLVFDSLTWTAENGDIISQIAKDWSYNQDTFQYNFIIHKGIKWHDGEDLTTEDIEFSVDYYQKHPLPWLDVSMIKEVVVEDQEHIKFVLNNHYAPFIKSVACGMPILPKHIYELIDNPYVIHSMTQCVGSGPYKLENYSSVDKNYVFVAHKNYYNGDPSFSHIEFIHMSPEMQLNALIKGTIDMMRPSGEMLSMLQNEGLNIESTDGLAVKLKFNSSKFPFNEVKFRQAMAYAIDRNELISIVLNGQAYLGQAGYIKKTSSYYNPKIPNYDYNLEKSHALMCALGYEKINGYYAMKGEVLTFELLGYDIVKREVEVLVNQLNEAGFKVKPVLKELSIAEAFFENGDYDLGLMSSRASGDPIYMNEIINTKTSTSEWIENQRMNMLLSGQIKSVNEKQRKAQLDEIQMLYAEDIPAHILFYYKFDAAFNDKARIYFTNEGFGFGVQLPYNKLIFLEKEEN